jgi:hypothetical protein
MYSDIRNIDGIDGKDTVTGKALLVTVTVSCTGIKIYRD